jgi:hypothetical protein
LTKIKAAAKESRGKQLQKILEDRRRELMSEVHGKIRDARADGTKEREVLDQGESSGYSAWLPRSVRRPRRLIQWQCQRPGEYE